VINARKSYKWGNRPEWFGRRAQYGGTIPWVGIHALDYVQEITSQPLRSIFASHANVAHPQHPECEDAAAMVITLADRTQATASLDLLRPAAADTHGDDWVRVVGSAGVLEASMTRNTCRVTTESEPAHDLPLPPRRPAFVPLLRSIADGTVGRDPSAEMRRAFLLTHASLCARDAADRGMVVLIEPFQMH
jgi:predicted dehydrogenase